MPPSLYSSRSLYYHGPNKVGRSDLGERNGTVIASYIEAYFKANEVTESEPMVEKLIALLDLRSAYAIDYLFA